MTAQLVSDTADGFTARIDTLPSRAARPAPAGQGAATALPPLAAGPARRTTCSPAPTPRSRRCRATSSTPRSTPRSTRRLRPARRAGVMRTAPSPRSPRCWWCAAASRSRCPARARTITQVAEDATVPGVHRRPATTSPGCRTERVDALLTATPVGNVADALARTQLERALARLPGLAAHLDATGRAVAAALVAEHRAVRTRQQNRAAARSPPDSCRHRTCSASTCSCPRRAADDRARRVQGGPRRRHRAAPRSPARAPPSCACPARRAADYQLPPGMAVNAAIARAWEAMLAAHQQWQRALGRLPDNDPAVKLTRDKWLLPLLVRAGLGPPRGDQRRPRRPAGPRRDHRGALPGLPPRLLARHRQPDRLGAAAPRRRQRRPGHQDRVGDRPRAAVDAAGLPQPRRTRAVGHRVQRPPAAAAARRLHPDPPVVHRVRPRRHLHQPALRRLPAAVPHRPRQPLRPPPRRQREEGGIRRRRGRRHRDRQPRQSPTAGWSAGAPPPSRTARGRCSPCSTASPPRCSTWAPGSSPTPTTPRCAKPWPRPRLPTSTCTARCCASPTG